MPQSHLSNSFGRLLKKVRFRRYLREQTQFGTKPLPGSKSDRNVHISSLLGPQFGCEAVATHQGDNIILVDIALRKGSKRATAPEQRETIANRIGVLYIMCNQYHGDAMPSRVLQHAHDDFGLVDAQSTMSAPSRISALTINRSRNRDALTLSPPDSVPTAWPGSWISMPIRASSFAAMSGGGLYVELTEQVPSP